MFNWERQEYALLDLPSLQSTWLQNHSPYQQLSAFLSRYQHDVQLYLSQSGGPPGPRRKHLCEKLAVLLRQALQNKSKRQQ